MAVRPTLQLGDPLLRSPCHNVSDTSGPDLHRLAEDLSDTLADWVNRTGYGRGIAAPQIGEPARVVYLTMGSPQALINPTITAHSSATWEVWDAYLSATPSTNGSSASTCQLSSGRPARGFDVRTANQHTSACRKCCYGCERGSKRDSR
jgi:hypothetical protein